MSAASTIAPCILKYIGPNKTQFISFEEQCAWFLNGYCPQWNNYLQPKAYLLPPTFKFQLAEVSDEVVKATLANPSTRLQRHKNLIQTRFSDEAEFVVYRDILKIAHDLITAPFIAIHNLTLDDKRVLLLKKIHTSEETWQQFHQMLKAAFESEKRGTTLEFDFCICGPSIGIVFIEVKSSDFHGAFVPGDQHLPDEYKHGLRQLKAADAFLFLVQNFAYSSFPVDIGESELCTWVSRLLITPNLERARYAAWAAKLNPSSQEALNRHTKHVIQVFKESFSVSDTYSSVPSFNKYLETFLLSLHPKRFTHETYEAYSMVMTGLASVTLVPCTNADTAILNELSYSSHLSMLVEGLRILDQHPVEGKHPYKAHADSLLLPASKDSETRSAFQLVPLVFLSPEQQAVLKGGSRQILYGPAGTGKTVLVQAKAIELLSKEQSVIVVASNMFRSRYKMAFDEHKYSKYRIYRWGDLESHITCAMQRCEIDLDSIWSSWEDFMAKEINYDTTVIFLHKCINILQENDRFVKELHAFICEDHIFIDDAFITIFHHDGNWLTVIALLLVASWDRIRYIWFTIDPFQNDTRLEHEKSLVAELRAEESVISIVIENIAPTEFQFTTTNLNRVMRCSEEVFRSAYSTLDWSAVQMAPICGHKVPGIRTRTYTETVSTYADAWNRISFAIPQFLQSIKDISVESPHFFAFVLSGAFETKTIKMTKCLETAGFTAVELFNYHRQTAVADEKENMLFNLQCLSPELGDICLEDEVVVLSSFNAASFEWPVVVLINGVRGTSDVASTGRDKMLQYIARSRAVVSFVEFNYIIESSDSQAELETYK